MKPGTAADAALYRCCAHSLAYHGIIHESGWLTLGSFRLTARLPGMVDAPSERMGGQRRQLAIAMLFLPIVVSLHLLVFGETGLRRVRYFDALKN